MRQEGGFEVVFFDARAVVRHADELLAAALRFDGDLGGACVDGVFDELLDDGVRPVDDLACRDAVIDFGGQNVDHLFSFQRTMS